MTLQTCKTDRIQSEKYFPMNTYIVEWSTGNKSEYELIPKHAKNLSGLPCVISIKEKRTIT